MKASDAARTDRILQTAAWTYLVPRAAIAILLLLILGLGAFLILMPIAIAILQRFGA